MAAASDTHSNDLPNTRAKLPILAIFAVWTAWGVWSAQTSVLSSLLSGQEAPERINALQLSLTAGWLWSLMTIALMWITRFYRDRISYKPARIAAHVFTYACVHLIDITAYWLATDYIAHTPRLFLPMLVNIAVFNLMSYCVVVGVINVLDARHEIRTKAVRESQLETQLALAQFHALRAQLHPHFLFNSLNAISSLIHSDPSRADRMLARVSELLRIAIDTAAKPEVTLHEEVEFAKRYLEVERMRYGDRLDVRINVAGETFDALVPNMLLQPLVENAVRHGVAPHARNGCVEISASRKGDGLSIVVRDSGAGFDDDESLESTGVGLSTTRARLEKLYGASQQLVFAIVPDGFETRIMLPFRWREAIST